MLFRTVAREEQHPPAVLSDLPRFAYPLRQRANGMNDSTRSIVQKAAITSVRQHTPRASWW